MFTFYKIYFYKFSALNGIKHRQKLLNAKPFLGFLLVLLILIIYLRIKFEINL